MEKLFIELESALKRYADQLVEMNNELVKGLNVISIEEATKKQSLIAETQRLYTITLINYNNLCRMTHLTITGTNDTLEIKNEKR